MPAVTLYAMFIHADRDIALRPLRYVVNSPAFHRWHHAVDVSDGTKNYAGLFPIYDKIFGSYYLPDHAPAAIGIAHDDVPDTCAAQLLYPFRRRSSGEPPRAKRGELRSLRLEREGVDGAGHQGA
jgi:sterol desaturase/sphingolipid hydroxylase (fatty acid hydroxylase superfamily)